MNKSLKLMMGGATELSSVVYFLWKSRAWKKGVKSWWIAVS